MASNLAVFDQKAPGATTKLVFDFISVLGVGVTISAPGVSASVWTGVDASPGSIVTGTVVSGTQAVCTVTGGVAGVIYKLTCSATTSDGQTVVMYGYLAVIGDPL